MDHIEKFEIPDEAVKRLSDPNLIQEQIRAGKTFQEIIGYTSDQMVEFYEGAYNLFHLQEYEKSADAFVFLTTLNPYVHNYWLGLGMSEQLNEHHHAALLAYSMAILTDTNTPIPHYHSAKCYIEIDEKDNAIRSLETAKTLSSISPKYDNLKDTIDAVLNKLKG